MRDILSFEPRRSGTSLKAALEFLGHVVRRRAVVFIVSDFLDQGFETQLGIASRKHDVTAVTLTDPHELALPPVGLVELEDLEAERRILVDASDARVRAAFERQVAAEREALSKCLRKAGAGEIRVRTDETYTLPIVRYLRAREKARVH